VQPGQLDDRQRQLWAYLVARHGQAQRVSHRLAELAQALGWAPADCLAAARGLGEEGLVLVILDRVTLTRQGLGALREKGDATATLACRSCGDAFEDRDALRRHTPACPRRPGGGDAGG